LRLSAQLRHNSAYFSDDANTPALRIAGTSVMDFRATYALRQFSIFGYVRNLFDAFYLTSLLAENVGAVGDPRKFGVGVEARF
jgi:iron complex outermembrane receptor protein